MQSYIVFTIGPRDLGYEGTSSIVQFWSRVITREDIASPATRTSCKLGFETAPQRTPAELALWTLELLSWFLSLLPEHISQRSTKAAGDARDKCFAAEGNPSRHVHSAQIIIQNKSNKNIWFPRVVLWRRWRSNDSFSKACIPHWFAYSVCTRLLLYNSSPQVRHTRGQVYGAAPHSTTRNSNTL